MQELTIVGRSMPHRTVLWVHVAKAVDHGLIGNAAFPPIL